MLKPCVSLLLLFVSFSLIDAVAVYVDAVTVQHLSSSSESSQSKEETPNQIQSFAAEKGESSSHHQTLLHPLLHENGKLKIDLRSKPRQRLGTAREQVQQMTYRLKPQKSNETTEEFEARKAKKEKTLQFRKNAQLKIINDLEKKSGEADVTDQYNDYVRNKLDMLKVERIRRNKKLGLPEFTLEELKELKQKNEESIDKATRLNRQRRAISHQKNRLIKLTKNEETKKWALDKAKRLGIVLESGHKVGAKKTAIRKKLWLAPNDPFLREQARLLGMDPDIQPTPSKRKLRQGKSLSSDAPLLGKDTNLDETRRAASTSVTQHLASNGDTIPTPTNFKPPLPFDLNHIPPADDEM